MSRFDCTVSACYLSIQLTILFKLEIRSDTEDNMLTDNLSWDPECLSTLAAFGLFSEELA